MSHKIQTSPELLADLGTIAELMKKHNLSFCVEVIGDTHGLSYEPNVCIGWNGIVCGEQNEITAVEILSAKSKLEGKT